MASIEPVVESWAMTQISELGWSHGPKQVGRNLDTRVDEALKSAPSKSGGQGGNQPDHVIVIDNGAIRIPVLCEWKGTRGHFRDKKNIELRDENAKLRYGKAGIDKYAAHGAAYYASRVVGPHGGHTRALALAANGYFQAPSDVAPYYEVALYVVDKTDTENIIWVGDYSDFSILHRDNFDSLQQDIEDALDPEAAKQRKSRQANSLNESLRKLNEFLHKELGIMPAHRVNVVSALMIASLGVKDESGQVLVRPLSRGELWGGLGKGSDGNIILQRVEDYLEHRIPRIPQEKQSSIINSLRPTLLDDHMSKKRKTGDSPLKEAFLLVSDGLLPHYNNNRNIDFTGQLFNEMYNWIDIPDAGANDVVLTPKKTTELMVELTRIDSDSFVWDWTLGTGAFLVSAMNTMIADAKERYQGADLIEKENQIKINQLLGIERLGPMYVLAVLNMILMGDGSANILHMDAHDFDGEYQKGEKGSPEGLFPATTLVLNPPYSAPGNGLIFVKEAFDKMIESKTGKYGAVIIQDSAGSGKAVQYCQQILKGSTLEASIKMPPDLFIGKSGVETAIYVFKVGIPHRKDSLVKFIDFSNDGFRRTNRKKVKDPSVNLIPRDNPDARYAEVSAIITGRKYDSNFYPFKKLYFTDTIDPQAGNDWNFDRHIQVEGSPDLEDHLDVVTAYAKWQVDRQALLTDEEISEKTPAPINFSDLQLSTEERAAVDSLGTRDYIYRPASDFFKVRNNKQRDSEAFVFDERAEYPYFTRTVLNNGIKGYVEYVDDEYLAPGNVIAVGMLGIKFFYLDHDFYCGQFTKSIVPTFEGFSEDIAMYFITCFNRHSRYLRSYGVRDFSSAFGDLEVPIPLAEDGTIDTHWITIFVRALRKIVLQRAHERYLRESNRMLGLISKK